MTFKTNSFSLLCHACNNPLKGYGCVGCLYHACMQPPAPRPNNGGCLHAPSEDTNSERKEYIIDVETCMSVQVHAMLVPGMGMCGPKSVNKAHKWGTTAYKKAYKC